MLHPLSEPHDQGWLDVGHGHRIRYEQSGRRDGIPALYLHGGPGSGCSPRQRALFDPAHYRVVMFDQRGCGLSTPAGETRHNHTDALISDIEMLRAHLGIERWLVFGGSWGATLAALYAARHASACSGVLMRGLFLAGRADIDWFFQGAAALAPAAHARFLQSLPARWRRRVVEGLARAFASGDRRRTETATLAWRDWEHALGTWPAHSALPAPTGDELAALGNRYRIQSHYLQHRCFTSEAKVLDAIARLRGLPVAFIHGTRDMVCRPQNAWRAHRTLSGSALFWAHDAGHDPYHPASLAAIDAALSAFARDGAFPAASGME